MNTETENETASYSASLSLTPNESESFKVEPLPKRCFQAWYWGYFSVISGPRYMPRIGTRVTGRVLPGGRGPPSPPAGGTRPYHPASSTTD